MYRLVAAAWFEEYDPLWCFFHIPNRTEYQTTMPRFVLQVQRRMGAGKVGTADVWMPLRVPRVAHFAHLPEPMRPLLDLLRCGTFFRIIATVLYRVRAARVYYTSY